MNIDLDRLCMLAGVNSQSSSSSLIREGVTRKDKMGEDSQFPEGEGPDLPEGEHPTMDEDEGLDEIIEIDEQMLVQELRRAKSLMRESKRTAQRRKKNILEAELKTIIESEVESVMRELNLNSGWVYGNDKPRASKKGYTHQGSYLKGIGFK